jgi:hypothetical protein
MHSTRLTATQIKYALMAVVGLPLSVVVVAKSTAYAPVISGSLLALLVPSGTVLAGAVVLGHGLGNEGVRSSLYGPLGLTDLLLLVWLFRSLGQRQASRGRGSRYTIAALTALIAFLSWSLLVTYIDGASITPLVRLVVYGAVFAYLAMYGVNRKQLYIPIVLYAVFNIVVGIALGQHRLTGFDVGDPAQMGGLILAALCPLLSRELRFRGRWLIVAMLLCGIILTQTRSVWFATIVVLVVWAQRRLSLRRVIMLTVSLTFIGLIVVAPLTRTLGLNETSADLRIQSISNGIQSGLAHPLLGSGWASISVVDLSSPSRATINQYTLPFNLFVNIFTSVGLPGVLLFLAFFAILLRRLSMTREAPLLFTVAVLAMSITEMTIYAGSTLTILFFIYAGMGLNDRSSARAHFQQTPVLLDAQIPTTGRGPR